MMVHERLIEVAYRALYDRPLPFTPRLRYSGRFKGFNANVQLQHNRVTFSLSKRWRPVSQDIKIGLLQELFVKLTKRKAHTVNMDLYNYFLRSVDKTIAITHTDPLLESWFHKLNARFFYGLMDRPNLKWGKMSTTTLGHYDFGQDCITISRIFHPDHCDDATLAEFVLYHEMLHKHHKFESRAGRTSSHTPAFRRDEAKFPNKPQVERSMQLHAQRYRGKKTTKRWNFLDFF